MSYVCKNTEILKRLAQLDTMGERQKVTSAVCKTSLMHVNHAIEQLSERAMIHKANLQSSAQVVIAAAGLMKEAEDLWVAVLDQAISAGE